MEASRHAMHFQDRYSLIRRFCEVLNGEPAENRILVFSGEEGIGKSCLLRRLRDGFCKCLDRERWARLVQEEDEGLVAGISGDEHAVHVPSGWLDFADVAGSCGDPWDPLWGPLALRKSLAVGDSRPGRFFPRFDFALAALCMKKSISEDTLSRLPGPVVRTAGALGDFCRGRGKASSCKSVLESITGERYFGDYFPDAAGAKDFLRQALPSEADEVIVRLPVFLALDLGVWVRSEWGPPRIAVFLDGLESPGGFGAGESSDEYRSRDEWVRRMLLQPEFGGRIVVALACRRAPAWNAAPSFPVSPGRLEILEVVGLSRNDGSRFLEEAGFGDEGDRERALGVCRLNSGDDIHPFCLSMLAHFRRPMEIPGNLEPSPLEPSTTATTRDWRVKELVDRLLESLPDEERSAVLALSACRFFDWEIYEHLGKHMRFKADRALFGKLLEVSSMHQAGGRTFYRLHELMRRSACSFDPRVLQVAHEVMMRYHGSRKSHDPLRAAAEETYHLLGAGGGAGLEALLNKMEEAEEEGQWDLLSELVAMAREVHADDRVMDACINQSLAEYYTSSGGLERAEAYLGKVIELMKDEPSRSGSVEAWEVKGRMLSLVGWFNSRSGLAEEAERALEDAVDSYRSVLELSPDNLRASVDECKTSQMLAELCCMIGREHRAKSVLWGSLTALSRSLEWYGEDTRAYVEFGKTLSVVGQLSLQCGEEAEAEKAFQDALVVLGEVLELDPENCEARVNRGLALRWLSELRMRQGRKDEVESIVSEAIESLESAFESCRQCVDFLEWLGLLHVSLSDLLVEQGRHSEAEAELEKSADVLSRLAELVPDDPRPRNNRGTVYCELATLLMETGRKREGEMALRRAHAAFEDAIQADPEYIGAHGNKGAALSMLGSRLYESGRYSEAESVLRSAIASFDRVLVHMGGDVAAHVNRATALTTLAEALSKQGRRSEAEFVLRNVLKACDNAPEDPIMQESVRKAADEARKMLKGLSREDS